jgi:hypothetical protein
MNQEKETSLMILRVERNGLGTIIIGNQIKSKTIIFKGLTFFLSLLFLAASLF